MKKVIFLVMNTALR